MGIRTAEGGDKPHHQDHEHFKAIKREGQVLGIKKSEEQKQQPSKENDVPAEAKVVFTGESGNVASPEDLEAKKRTREHPVNPAISNPDFNKYRPRKQNQLMQKYTRDLILYVLKGGE